MSARALKSAPVRGERVQLAIPRRVWPVAHGVLLSARITGVDAFAAGEHVHLSLSPEAAELLRALPGVVTP